MNNLRQYFTDLHIHVGFSENGHWVKIPTSKRLTVRNILKEAKDRKGMNIIGLVDALSPWVLADVEMLVEEGLLTPLAGGGYCYDQNLTVLLGAEIETTETDGGSAHTLVFLQDIEAMKNFSRHMSSYIKNVWLSSQNAHMGLAQLIDIGAAFDGIIIPAHIFTPYKSVYGACADRLDHILNEKQMQSITAVELGLSADTDMADRIEELHSYSYVSNSDAHSLDKIGREYNVFALETPSFHECLLALRRNSGRRIAANYGLDPRLGKYHRTLCLICGYIETKESLIIDHCPACGGQKLVKGVLGRIDAIADYAKPEHPSHRPPYIHQIPLEFVPGLGKKTLERLLTAFKTEMYIMHRVSCQELAAVAGEKIAKIIVDTRRGRATITEGAGGIYGRLT